MIMILAVIGLVGFTIATNEKVSSETAFLHRFRRRTLIILQLSGILIVE